MSQSLPNVQDVDQGAAILAIRLTIAQRTGGIDKEADWKDTIDNFAKNLMTRKPTVGGKNYWGNVGWEALRNALIGAGVGGVGGTISSLFSKRRKKDPWGKALRGALLGAAVGGGGTAAVRGGQYAWGGAKDIEADVKQKKKEESDKIQAVRQAEEQKRRELEAKLRKAQDRNETAELTQGGGRDPGVLTAVGAAPGLAKDFLTGEELGSSAERLARRWKEHTLGPEAGEYAALGGATGAGLGLYAPSLYKRYRATQNVAYDPQGASRVGVSGSVRVPKNLIQYMDPAQLKPIYQQGGKKGAPKVVIGHEAPAQQVFQARAKYEGFKPWRRFSYGRLPGVSGGMLHGAQPKWGWRRQGLTRGGLAGLFGFGGSALGAKIDAAKRNYGTYGGQPRMMPGGP